MKKYLKGFIYRKWSKLIHRFGYHYAPKQYPPEPPITREELRTQTVEWYHWCHWCGLRGSTLEITQLNPTPPNKGKD